MMRNLRNVVIAATLLVVLWLPRPAYAHVLIRDDSKQLGAVLHINPDDDPIAGKPSSFFFDIQGQNLAGAIAKLQVTDETGAAVNAPTVVSASSVSATYTFPTQGVYGLRLTLSTKNQEYIFNYPQRVSRGVASTALNRPSYPWAEVTLVTTVSLFLILLIIAFNRRAEIAKQSKL